MESLNLGRPEKVFYDAVYREDHLSNYGGDPADPGWQKRIGELTDRTKAWLVAAGFAGKSEASVLEIGCGLAYLNDVHPSWHGVEYSQSAVERAKAKYGEVTRISYADVQFLPFPDERFEWIYSWAVLEHIPNPDKGFSEIDRVCKTGGCVMLAPAWNCRSWTVEKLPQRSYSSLDFIGKISKFTIPVREHIFFRALSCLPGRIYDEFRLLAGKPLSLGFHPLYPRWDLIKEFGHISDDDAVAEIDPHSAICFFRSRGYEILSHPTWISAMMARSEPVVARKRGTR